MKKLKLFGALALLIAICFSASISNYVVKVTDVTLNELEVQAQYTAHEYIMRTSPCPDGKSNYDWCGGSTDIKARCDIHAQTVCP